jgi:hypothetical protein
VYQNFLILSISGPLSYYLVDSPHRPVEVD